MQGLAFGSGKDLCVSLGSNTREPLVRNAPCHTLTAYGGRQLKTSERFSQAGRGSQPIPLHPLKCHLEMCVGRGEGPVFLFFWGGMMLCQRDCCECSPVLVWASLKTEQGNEVYTAVRTIWIRHWEELSPRRGRWRESRRRFKPHQYYLLPVSLVPRLQPSWSSFCPLNVPFHLLSSLPCLTFPLTTGSFRY